MSREILGRHEGPAIEKGIAPDRLIHALEDALLSAYKKQPGAAKYARVGDGPRHRRLPRDRADRARAPGGPPDRRDDRRGHLHRPRDRRAVEPQDPEIDPAKFEEYRDQIDERDVTPDDFGRIAAQTAKQVILQRIREAERDMMFEEYRDRVGELITGIVQQSDSRYTLVQLRERVEALLPKSEQVDGERYDHSQRIKAVIKEVSPSTKGPSIIVSRRDPELIKKLFELEVPEIADGLVEIANVAREPGYRSKIAVVSYADGVDPVGACVGPRGSRVRMVVSELRGEKIDIIPYNDEPARFVAKALSPARVREVLVDDERRQATVVVPDDQLSLAIGREGQNARLPRADRLAHRHQVRDRVRHRGARRRLPGGGDRRALRGDPRQRPALPQRGAARLALLRPRQPPGARGTGTVYVAGEPPAELVGENGEVEEAVAEEALAGGRRVPGGQRRLVEEAVAEAPVDDVAVQEVAVEEVAVDDADALEPAPEAAEPDALAADTEPALETTDGQPLPQAATAESAPRRGDGGGARLIAPARHIPSDAAWPAGAARPRRRCGDWPCAATASSLTPAGRCPAGGPTSAARPARRRPSSDARCPGPFAGRCPLTMTS
jgi:N utilization substance protein A